MPRSGDRWAFRRKEVALIKAAEEAEKDRIEADKAAYVETKKAEAERDAAEKRAEAAKEGWKSPLLLLLQGSGSRACEPR